MSDFKDFINLLFRHRYVILALPLVAAISTYFLVRKSPDTYTSIARIETGISDQSDNVLNDEAKPKKDEIDQKFTNLIQLALLKRVLQQVSYQLILHDLTSSKPFRPASKDIQALSNADRKLAIELYKYKLKTRTDLSVYDKRQKILSNVIESMHYDYESFDKKLLVFRANNSDFIDIKFESEDPELSAFVANTASREFIAYHRSMVERSQGSAVNYLTNLLQVKLDTLNNRMLKLKLYKTRNRILYLNEQAHALFGQIKDYETFKETTQKEELSLRAALGDLDKKFNPNDRMYLEATQTKVNGDIVESKRRLSLLNEKYVASNFDVKYKAEIDSIRNKLSSQINESTDKYIYNPLATKQALVAKKMEMEISLDLAKNGLVSIDGELTRLNTRFDELVPHEAEIQSYERGVDVAAREYIEILERFNQANMASSYAISLRQIEIAVPGPPAAAKRLLFVIISGIVTAIFCLIVFFVIFYLDEDIKLSKHLVFKTGMPVLGYMPSIKYSVSELIGVLDEGQSTKHILEFKDQIRAIRFEVDQELHGAKLLSVTSIITGEGKTMFSTALAYAYSLTNKKVLLIDGNFENPELTGAIGSGFYIEDFLRNKISQDQLPTNLPITLLGNRGRDVSLFELNDETHVREQLKNLEDVFDIIIIDTPPLSTLNKAEEWVVVSDKVVAIFAANKSLSKEMKMQSEYLKTDKKYIGWVLNKVTIAEGKLETKKRKVSKIPFE